MKVLKNENFRYLILLTIISGLVYLPLVNKFSYTHDDWYLMYAAKVRGATIFHEIFRGDRPLRAFVMIPAYTLFGENPLYYNLSAYFFRLLSGLGFLYTLRLLWKKENLVTFSMALLFLLYPGFLSQPNGIDYQSQMVALAMATFSLWLTLKSLQSTRALYRYGFLFLSVILAWFYLGLVEYFIGVEILRFLLIITLALRIDENWRKKIIYLFRWGIPFLLASLPFIYWRFFLFESERGATDFGKQFSVFLSNPRAQALLWVSHLFEDSKSVLLGAWQIPLAQFYQTNVILLNGIKILFILLVLVGSFAWFYKGKKKNKIELWQKEAFFIGFFSLIACQIPIVIVNRQVSFPVYSRYALAGSLGAAMILVALFSLLRPKIIQIALTSLLIFIAFLTHSANTHKFVAETASMNNFWWQVSWRVPHFEEGATLLVNYPLVSTEESYFIWGPANQIYYPDGASDRVVQTGVYALILNDETVAKVIARERQEYSNRRGVEGYPNARNIIILTQPTQDSCVQIIDGFQPMYSEWENERIKQIGAFSEVEHILTTAAPATPPEVVFGPEPAHRWCYIYQKATLARQKGDWTRVYDLDQQASQGKFVPQDSIEWMPFLQASAMFGDEERVREISSYIKDEFVRQQACDILLGMDLTPAMYRLAEKSYCTPQ